MPVRSFRRSFPANFTPHNSSFRPAFLVAAAISFSATSARAQLTLTPAGVSRGFGLQTFATGFGTGSLGPEGVAYAPDGTVLVANSGHGGNLQRFQNINDQSAITTPILASYGGDNANGLGYLGTTAYMSQYQSGRVVQLNQDGTLNRVVTTGLSGPLGIAPNPLTGRLFVGLANGLINLDPISGSFTTLVSGVSADGVTLSPDGSTVYAAIRGGTNAQSLIGYNTTSGAIVYNSGVLSGGIDGTALGFGPFQGFIYANMNSGTVLELNLALPGSAPITIANNGSRGDMVGFDPSGSGDMLITQSDRIIRLTGIPAPSTAALLGLGGLMSARRRR